jgi:hypothetical protein
MSFIKRRQFLQFSASTLATVGLNQFDIISQGKRYGQVLAQNAPRKLALLVGINEYPGNLALKGCVNDVRLQKELLIHRFGFKDNDILTLTDKQATRKGILTAFEDHLIKQAKRGDVVVFHFSGHGSRVVDPDRDSPDGLNSTFVPIDSQLPPGFPVSGGPVQDIMGHTLFLLMYALKTDNVTVVLDSCHSGGGTRGNFRVRSRAADGSILQPSNEEFEYQKQWLGRLGLSKEKFIELRRKGVAKGVVIAAAKREQLASDASFSNFYAGAFTYELTQYLWQQTADEPVTTAIANVGRNTKEVARQRGNTQEPEIEVRFSKENYNAPIYFTRSPALSAEAVITQVTGNQVELWLGGLDSQTLEAFDKDAIFTVVDAKGGERGLVKLESRTGLIGKGTLQNTPTQRVQLQPGTLLQERIRSIPNNLTLKIGVDNAFDNNTAKLATQALQGLQRIEPKPLGTVEVQYIFGRMTQDRYQKLQKQKISNLPAVNSFGLFLPSLEQIIPASFGNSGEAVSAAVKRLQPKLKSLLAARIVNQVLGNTNSSQINLRVSMNIAGRKEVVGETFPIRGRIKNTVGSNQARVSSVKFSNSGVIQLPLSTEITFQVENNESQPLYVSILVIDAEGEMTVIFPNNWTGSENAALIEAKQKRVIPRADDGFKLTIGKPLGFSEALIITSTTPLRTSLKALQQIALGRGVANRNTPIAVTDEVLDVTNSLLDDLDAGTRSNNNNIEGIALPSGVRGIDVKKLAAMAIAFEVVGS